MSALIIRKISAPISYNIRGQNHVHRRGTVIQTDRRTLRQTGYIPPNLFEWGIKLARDKKGVYIKKKFHSLSEIS